VDCTHLIILLDDVVNVRYRGKLVDALVLAEDYDGDVD